ncbi:MAG: MGH1-like glycoside hydrolase domain-containing protein [Nakamurella sp.]
MTKTGPSTAAADPAGPTGAERQRLAEANSGRMAWREWGPYVAERAWGTVREDYSDDGDAWVSFPFEQAVSRSYRWNEDGLCAWSDAQQHACFGVALWNGVDPILKERAFGLANAQGNHGEDVKDYFWYVDNTPTHSYMRTRYAYPLAEFPYAELLAGNAARGRDAPEYELVDTGVFGDPAALAAGQPGNYALVTCEWAKAGPRDVCLTISVQNRSDREATVHVLPTVWFRNTWSWGKPAGQQEPTPRLFAEGEVLRGHHPGYGELAVVSAEPAGTGPSVVGAATPEMLFCDNETNVRKLYGEDADASFAGAPATRYPKDGINDHLVSGAATVNPDRQGTKGAFHHVLVIPAGQTQVVTARLTCDDQPGTLGDIDTLTKTRAQEADAFWHSVFGELDDEQAKVARQAMAGLLASKQYYPYDVRRWLAGDPSQPAPPAGHLTHRNAGWTTLFADDVILMPDSWEYPWFASWDLAFQCVALAPVDPELAKAQLLLLLREWYQHPNGQIPAYEWDFSDVNPPVQAWAALQIFHIDGGTDTAFLERAIHKLLINFTWWVNRQDAEGNNLFEGGFLGLDNIGPFDRSKPLPGGAVLEQSDGTAWMAMYCLDMLNIAIELASGDHSYDDVATKFLEHFCLIADAANDLGLWDADDGFYYDLIRQQDGATRRVPVRSIVGLIPLLAVGRISEDVARAMPGLADRLAWLLENRPETGEAIHFDRAEHPGLLALCGTERLPAVLRTMLDTGEFLSPHGIRSVSAAHQQHPVTFDIDGVDFSVDYEPAESRTALFGGNSNWRGPIWFPINALLISSLRRYGEYTGNTMRVELPTGSGRLCTLSEAADELTARLIGLFLPAADGQRPCQAGLPWQDDIFFNEYFHGDTGFGLGASHQTGWTALVATLALGWPR